MNTRNYSWLDHALNAVEQSLTTLLTTPSATRPSPAVEIEEQCLTTTERKYSAALMRVNHSGEVCAQALYYGQELVAQKPAIRQLLTQAACEETDHLAWIQQRLLELQSRPSYLNFWWFSNSFLIGMTAGLLGDAWSLGFVEETERQVANHLTKHLKNLPAKDLKSRAIVKQMHHDEQHHGNTARAAGAKPLPTLIKMLMQLHAKVMTTAAYWI